jgi:hypothetical protein
LKTKAEDATDATDAKILTQSTAQSRQAIAGELMREAARRELGLHLDKDGDLKRHDVPIDPAFLMELKKYKPDIIAVLQNGGGWNDAN